MWLIFTPQIHEKDKLCSRFSLRWRCYGPLIT
nr:MAG TPA: hypothetical protein [Bacteriophage sp.]